MENEHKIIIVMLAVIIYLVLEHCKCKAKTTENYGTGCGPMTPREPFRGPNFDVDPAQFAQHIRRSDLPNDAFAQRVNTREGFRQEDKVPFTSFAQRINSTDISGGQYVRHHIRNNLKNSMISHINNGN
jgi:hypothetical protein